MAEFVLSLAHKDDNGITTATSWVLSEKTYRDIMDNALQNLGPPCGSLMASPGGASEITRLVRDNIVEF